MPKYYITDKSNAKCVRVLDRHTLRVYTDNFEYNKNINYYDLYLDEHYMQNFGTEWFWYNDHNNHSNFPPCVSMNDVTDDFYYRNDFDSILIIFLIISIFVFLIPFKVFSRLFGRWLKV